MARITCSECGNLTGSWRHTEYDAEGHGTAHLCDHCYDGARHQRGHDRPPAVA